MVDYQRIENGGWLASHRSKHRESAITHARSSPLATRRFWRLRTRVGPHARRGAVVAEFAVVAPVFFLMIIGFIEFGRALMVQQVLVNAARVGAREAILASRSATTQSVTDAVTDYTDGITVNPVTVAVSPDPTAANAGDMITVTASVNYNDVSWLPAPWFLGGATLSSSSTMRKEGFD